MIVVLLLIVLLIPSPSSAALTEGPRLASIYDTILAARFDAAAAELAHACPPAPVGACRALATVSLWWQIALDPESRQLDRPFTDAAAAAIAANDEWTRRAPASAEAWFYLAGSYAPLAQWRILRGERLAAARDGKRIKDALERALALDPGLKDAYFGIGLYHYYADVAPTAAKILRFLLLLPGGDRVQGLREMVEARQHGELLRGEADYQLHLVYLWYEQKPTEALSLVEELEARYPSNPIFLQRIAEIETGYLHDHPAAAAAWQTLMRRAESHEVAAPDIALVRAKLGLARELNAMDETDRALDLLHEVIAEHPAAPADAMAQARGQQTRYQNRLGLGPADKTPRASEAYRTGLEAWRAFERHAYPEADTLFTHALALAPADPVLAYRYGRLLEARGLHAPARAQFERVLAARPVAPAFVLASAYVECARLVERSGDRTRAIALYRAATTIVGADPHARDAARRALKQLTSTRQSQ